MSIMVLRTASNSSTHFLEQVRDFYGWRSAEDSPAIQRFQTLLSRFQSRHPHPTRITVLRAPGRVNLIGEHTDYNGYPVLPIAIEHDIAVAVAPTKGKAIEISNTDPKFGDRTFQLSTNIEPFQRGDWGNYVKAAVRGILGAGLVPPSRARGMSAVFSGTIPQSAGLSSSSALVVASALAFVAANGTGVARQVLAGLLPKAERYVGTESGGMDHAISLLAERGNALRIDFFPLRTEPVPIPEGYVFVICNSLVDASKSGDSQRGYNLRVVECRLAAALLAHKLTRIAGRPIEAPLLADLTPGRTGLRAKIIETAAEEIMGDQPLTVFEIARRLDKDESDVIRSCCTLNDGSVLSPPTDGFKPHKRYRHVTSEAQRVSDAVRTLRMGDLSSFGRLMNESHESCRDNYEVSCPELDELVGLARRHGALGARLTGAGFGGCTVNLVEEKKASTFIRAMKREFFESRKGPRNFGDSIFSCYPSRGAGVIGEWLELPG